MPDRGYGTLRRQRLLLTISAVVSATLWAYACGDGTTDPPPYFPEPNTVTVGPATAELTALGATVQLSAEVRDQNGAVMATATVSWASSDAAVATVSASGLVTAVANGSATITATAGAASGSATVTVSQVVSAVAVVPDTTTVVVGDTLRLAAEAHDANGHAVTGVAFAWTSGDTAVAVVDESGLVTGVGAGTAQVTATAAGVTGRAELAVENPLPTTIAVTPDTLVLTAVGQTAQLTAEVRNQVGRVMDGVPVAWLSAETTVAAVDASGLVTAVGNGAVTITATAGEASGDALVTVAIDLDRAALVALYNATDGPNWVDNTNWLTDALLGEWYGVTTDGAGRVVRIDLSGRWDREARDYVRHGLSGPIPPDLGNLSNLSYLGLSYNALSGPIPPELGGLSNLTGVSINSNDLSGPIPSELGDLSNLSYLGLSYNDLSGPIPPELGDLSNLTWLDLGFNQLSAPIPPVLGGLSNLTWLGLGGNDLSGPIPPELGGLSSLESLFLYRNNLSGSIPPELGNLANLTWLYLNSNVLTGPIPSSFLQLGRLDDFHISGNESLCVPGIQAFVTWHQGIERRDGAAVLCNAADVAVLTSLFEVAGGAGWTNSAGWLGDGAVEDWYGVRADTLGRVTALDLTRNGLTGRLSAGVGQLSQMTELKIADNADLSGHLPLSLPGLTLRALHYSGTGLCAPVNTRFRDWLSTIPSHEGTGAECRPLSEREVLEALYDATGGPNWTYNDNWLTDAPLRHWHGVKVDAQGRVVGLNLNFNALSGAIPPELGSLVNLVGLVLRADRLTGPIPPELGNLANLQSLYLNGNELTGPIPPELGNLANLYYLFLGGNGLTGHIPPELGGLANLYALDLSGNELTGPIPPELGGLANLYGLNLAANGLTGRIPAEVGGLIGLDWLYLGENELTGSLPPEFGDLKRLRTLALQANVNMFGALPASLISLAALETLQTGGTGLCAPSDAGFLEWLEGVANRRVALCEGEPAMAYLVQAVQSREFPVPLVAGEEALLRVFVTAGRENNESLPPVRASFYRNDALVHVADIPGKPGPIPTEVGEGSLAESANAVIPARVVRPGLEMVIEVAPDGTLDAGLGVARRIPATGRTAVDVRDMPVFDLTVVPFLWTQDPDSAVLESVDGMAADPGGHELLELTRILLPVGDLKVTAHDPVLSSSNNGLDLFAETEAIRVLEAGTGYFMGMMSGRVTGGAFGVGAVAFAGPHAGTIAHEIGHTFGLGHAPCGVNIVLDPAYPNTDGTTGAWGHDFREGSLVPPSWFELMSYCGPQWISDYNFTKALHHRLTTESSAEASLVADAAPSLLLWGSENSTGTLSLKPALIVDVPVALPDSAGQHRITGRTAAGATLFSLSFTMPETADGDGSSSFAFALPVRPGWEGSLATITLSGPGGTVTLDGDSDIPMTILRDPRTGQVRAILRELPLQAELSADAVGMGTPGLEVLFSRGIPDSTAWKR